MNRRGKRLQDAFSRIAFVVAVLALSLSALAGSSSNGPLHIYGDKNYYVNGKMELIGHAAVHQDGESLFADHITYEKDSKIVHAVGNAVFVGKTALLQGSEMHFNLETRTGTIIGGRVSTDQFTLSGERINKLGEGRFQAHRAEYSTCKDCPQSWTMAAEDVDLQLEGYAYLSNVTAKVMDAPGVWLPYLIVPIKTKRQTGLLMPQFGFTDEGFTLVQPFFWAINRSFDMTFGLGNYGGRGRRLEWEGRYALRDGNGKFNFYQLNDRTFRNYLANNTFTNSTKGPSGNRWALQAEQNQLLPFNIQEKFRAVDVSDSLYLTKVLGDVPGNGEAYLTSDVSLSHATDQVSTFVTARRFRNLMTPLTEDPRVFDPKTVQVFPQAEVTTNDKVFFGGALVGGLNLGIQNFQRSADFFDRDQYDTTPVAAGTPWRQGKDPIREAVRARINPTLYSTVRAWDAVAIVPRADYRHYFYDFHGKTSALSRGYLHTDVDIQTQFEKVYDRDPKSEFPKVKHLIRPIINYSLIPYRSESPEHPFSRQMAYAQSNSFTGYNFDNEDIVPLDSTLSNANYFAPEGNALSYGFTTQMARKRRQKVFVPKGEKAPEPTYSYDQPIEWSSGQSFNFREVRPGQGHHPLSRFYSLITANFDKSNGYVDYYYIPYMPVNPDTSRHVLSAGAQWIPEKGSGKRVLAYERSIGANYYYNRSSNQSQTQTLRLYSIFSINDYIMPGVAIEYNLLGKRWKEANTTLTFQSPSECWKLDLGYFQTVSQDLETGLPKWSGTFRMNLSLNLTGSGFGSFSDPKAMAAGTPAGNATNTSTPDNPGNAGTGENY